MARFCFVVFSLTMHADLDVYMILGLMIQRFSTLKTLYPVKHGICCVCVVWSCLHIGLYFTGSVCYYISFSM